FPQPRERGVSFPTGGRLADDAGTTSKRRAGGHAVFPQSPLLQVARRPRTAARARHRARERRQPGDPALARRISRAAAQAGPSAARAAAHRRAGIPRAGTGRSVIAGRPPGGGDGGAPAPDRAAGVRGRRARGDRAAARARAGAAGLTRRKAATIAAFASLLPAASAADRRLRAVDQVLVVIHRAGRDAGRGDHAGEADEAVLGRGQGACATGAGGAHHGRHLDGVHARGGVFDDRAVGEADRGAAALADHDPLAGLDGLAGGGRDELAAGAGHDRAVDLHRADGVLRERGCERGGAEEGGGGRGAKHGLHGVFLVYWGLLWGETALADRSTPHLTRI